jgi:hypothetical protein
MKGCANCANCAAIAPTARGAIPKRTEKGQAQFIAPSIFPTSCGAMNRPLQNLTPRWAEIQTIAPPLRRGAA